MQGSQFKADGLNIVNCLIGLSAGISGTYSGANIDQNSYVLVQKFPDDLNPIVLTTTQIEGILGYTISQISECEEILAAKSEAVVDETTLQSFWEDRTLDYYTGIIQTVCDNWQTYLGTL